MAVLRLVRLSFITVRNIRSGITDMASKAKWRALANASAHLAAYVYRGVDHLATDEDVEWVELSKSEHEAVEREMLALATHLKEMADRMGAKWKSKKIYKRK